MAEMITIEKQGEHVIFIGDLNKHVGNIVKDNHDKVSYGGNLIRDFLKSNPFILLNSTNKVKGGPFTRYNPSNYKEDKDKSLFALHCIALS